MFFTHLETRGLATFTGKQVFLATRARLFRSQKSIGFSMSKNIKKIPKIYFTYSGLNMSMYNVVGTIFQIPAAKVQKSFRIKSSI